jgi:hypothetical protein|nr:MAG TPA: Protein of unknown function (DUF1642) [Caudoviricetes sp.]
MNKKELIEKYKDLFEKLHVFPVVAISRVLKDLQQLDEPQKVTIPQFVADYIKDAKYYEWDLDDVCDHIAEEWEGSEISEWFYTLGNVDVFARAWLDGYEIEKEKQYKVKMKGIEYHNSYLKYNKNLKHWYFGSLFIYNNDVDTKTYHTRKELEEAGFGDVFDSPLFEVEEVKR